MKNNGYKPEADFEKESFSELINKIRKLPEEELSESFDEKFNNRLDDVILDVPFSIRIKKYLRTPKFKIYFSSGAVLAAAIILIVFVINKKDVIPTFNNYTNGNNQNAIAKDSLVNKKELKTNENIAKNKNKKDNSKEIEIITNDLNQTHNKGFAPRLYTPEDVNEILKTKEFSEDVHKDSLKNKKLSKDDSLIILRKLLDKIIK